MWVIAILLILCGVMFLLLANALGEYGEDTNPLNKGDEEDEENER